MRLIYVHGRDQQGKNPEHLQGVWDSSLRLGTTRARLPEIPVPSTLPFYGDELDGLVRALDTPQSTDVATKGDWNDEREAAFRLQLLRELATNAGVSDAAIAAQMRQATEKGVLNWGWVQAILRALDKSSVIGSSVLAAFTRDVFVYLNYPAVAKRIDAIVVDAVAGSEPTVVVAHSLGTIVAYRALSSLGKQANVLAFITIGSPLGLQTIRSHVAIAKPLSNPAGVRLWRNAFDRRDVVALRPLDVSTWNISPPIENHGKVKNTTDNRHGIEGYLNDALIASWIWQALS